MNMVTVYEVEHITRFNLAGEVRYNTSGFTRHLSKDRALSCAGPHDELTEMQMTERQVDRLCNNGGMEG